MEAAYADPETASVRPETKAALKLINVMTLRPDEVDHVLIKEARAAGVSDEALTDAATICALFNVINRLADTFHFHVPPQAAFDHGAPGMVKRGYALPPWLRLWPPQ